MLLYTNRGYLFIFIILFSQAKLDNGGPESPRSSAFLFPLPHAHKARQILQLYSAQVLRPGTQPEGGLETLPKE